MACKRLPSAGASAWLLLWPQRCGQPCCSCLGPLHGAVLGPLLATPSAVLPYLQTSCQNPSSAFQSHLLLVLQVWSSAPLSTWRRPRTTSTWTPQPPSPALPSPPGWPPTRCQSVRLSPLSCAPSAPLPAGACLVARLSFHSWAAARPKITTCLDTACRPEQIGCPAFHAMSAAPACMAALHVSSQSSCKPKTDCMAQHHCGEGLALRSPASCQAALTHLTPACLAPICWSTHPPELARHSSCASMQLPQHSPASACRLPVGNVQTWPAGRHR